MAVEGKPEPRPDGEVPYVPEVSVSTEYFKVLGVPLKAGRGFDDRDGYKNLGVAIVNEAFGRNYFPNENPIGRRIKMLAGPQGERPWLTIVGVVGDEKAQDFFHPMSWEEPAMVFCPPRPETAIPRFPGVSHTGQRDNCRDEYSKADRRDR